MRLNDSVRADCLMRALDSIIALLREEIDNPMGVIDTDVDSQAFLSPFADIALAWGLTEKQWSDAYKENAAYYEEHGITLK